MLDFIYMGSADLFGMERERTIQNEKNMFPGGTQATPFHDRKVSALGRSATLVKYQVEYLQSNSILKYEYEWICGIGYGIIFNAKFCKQ